LEKKHFQTHVTLGSCSTLVWKDVGKFSNIFTKWIAKYLLLSVQEIFLVVPKKWAVALHKVTFA